MFNQEKQTRNRRRTARKLARNEELRETLPPFQSSSTTTIIHIHHLTPIKTIDEVCEKIKRTTLYAVDTESQIIQGQTYGGLIQIQLIHSINSSTIILIETHYLPDRNSILFFKIKQLCEMIFNDNNKILTWGETRKEFDGFQNYGLFESGNPLKGTNVQFEFQKWHNNQSESNTHPPPGERRVDITWCYVTPGEYEEMEEDPAQSICNCGHLTHEDENATWNLQDAIAYTTHMFLDKTETRGKWTCGLDFELNTWRRRLFSKAEYNRNEEKEKRLKMIEYVINDCLAVTELYFRMHSLTMDNDYETPPLTTTTTTTNSRNIQIKNNYFEDLIDISEDDDEIIGIFAEKQFPINPPTSEQTSENELKHIKFPCFDKQAKRAPLASHDGLLDLREDELKHIKFPYFKKRTLLDNDLELITKTTDKEINELIEPNHEEKQPTSSSKSNKQRRKNEKLKRKQRTRPDFQNFIRRPIYQRYDYLKIKSQLRDDDIFSSHQITINKHRLEVKIGFKSRRELEEATKKMKSNYFSRDQYFKRWSE